MTTVDTRAGGRERDGHTHHPEPLQDYTGSPVECCSHHELEIDRYVLLYLAGGTLALTSWIARDVLSLSSELITILPAAIGAVLLSLPLFISSLDEIFRKNRISSSSLAALAILAALVTQQYITAAVLAFVLLVADQVLRRTAFGAQRAIEDLINLTPDTARIVAEDGTERTVGVDRVEVGQTVRVRPGENFPVDGRIVSGRTTINQASLTGEALPIEASEETEVFAGTSNLTGAIDLRVTLVGEDTTIGKVTQLIREAERAKSPRQLIVEQVARFFVPVALIVAALVLYLNRGQGADEAALMAVTVLVVVCPSALLLSSPSAMVAAFAAAARLGIMIKRTDYLESAASIDSVVLDKTGTLTTGRFEVSRLAPAEGVDGAELLRAAAYAEQRSNHPLAQSILRTAHAARIEPDGEGEAEEIHGRGVRATTTLGEIHAGRGAWIREIVPDQLGAIESVERQTEGMSSVHIVADGRYLGAVGLEDKVRPEAKSVFERLRELGVRTISIFTGDRLSVAKRVGVAVGADRVEAECLPEEKYELIRDTVAQGERVMMVGDGINDGPALAEAEVGVAMGLSGSDIAANSAGVALMTDDLNRLPFLIELARRTRLIITQNIAASILIALVGLSLAATGNLGEASSAIFFAAVFHFAGDVFVLGNSFRLFRFGEAFVAAERASREAERSRPRAGRREASVRLGGTGDGDGAGAGTGAGAQPAMPPAG